MSYGPEIESVYEEIRRNPGQDLVSIKQKFQYFETGDITSLIECALSVLQDLQFIFKDKAHYFVLNDQAWRNKEVFSRLSKIFKQDPVSDESLNYIFASLFEQLFVKPDRMFVTNIHYQVNSKFNKTLVGHEKINAWKRMMECWGLGRRLYSGFYALPQQTLMQDIVSGIEKWEGALHPFCENIIHPILPCVTSEGRIFRGVIFCLMALHHENRIQLSYKQDLPYKSYGPQNELNWITIERRTVYDDAMSQ